MQLLCLLALAAPALAFVATPSKPSATAVHAQKSASLPFLDRPEKVLLTDPTIPTLLCSNLSHNLG